MRFLLALFVTVATTGCAVHLHTREAPRPAAAQPKDPPCSAWPAIRDGKSFHELLAPCSSQ